MYNIIKKNQKKLLAVFGVLLMIVFIIPPAAKYGSNRNERVVGHIGKTPVYDLQLHQGREEWRWLENLPGQFDFTTGRQSKLVEGVLGREVFAQIENHPDLFTLIQLEAERHGIPRPTADQARGILVNEFRFTFESPDDHPLQVEAIRGLLMVRNAYQQLADTVKVSDPLWRRELQVTQKVRLNVVEFPAQKLEVDLREPSKEELEQQFHQFANYPRPEPNSPPMPGNPLRFGYQYPRRVKLQYIEIPKAQVAKTLIGSRDANAPEAQQQQYHAWEVKAADYYLKHQGDFRNVPPTTKPATAPATTTASATEPSATQSAATAPALASTQPTTKPFEEVRDQIIDRLIEPDVQKKTQAIEQFVRDRLTADWHEIAKTHPTAATAPTTQPASTQVASTEPATTQEAEAPTTQPALPAMTLAALQQIAEDVQKNPEFGGVLPSVHDLAADWLDQKALEALPGIGRSASTNGESFPSYAASFAIMGEIHPIGLQLWQPSDPLTDPDQNTYIFRLTAAQPAHPPRDMAPVAEQVLKDYKLNKAYSLAKQSAQKLVDAAKTSTLNVAAGTINEHPLIVGPFSPTEQFQRLLPNRNFFEPPKPVEIPGFSLKDRYSQLGFIQGAIGLLKDATPQKPHPVALIELPTEAKVIVAELNDVELAEPLWQGQEQVTQDETQRTLQRLAADWFTYSNVTGRLGYKSDVPEKDQGS